MVTYRVKVYNADGEVVLEKEVYLPACEAQTEEFLGRLGRLRDLGYTVEVIEDGYEYE